MSSIYLSPYVLSTLDLSGFVVRGAVSSRVSWSVIHDRLIKVSIGFGRMEW